MSKKVTTRFKRPRQRYFFREWRKYRGLTQTELAEVVGLEVSSISQLENAKQGFTDQTLMAFAEALNCSVADLLTRNPLDENSSSPWSVWTRIPDSDRPQALRVLQSFVPDGQKKAS